MRKLTMIVFLIALVIVAFETFKPQPPFPQVNTSYMAEAAVTAIVR